MKKKEKYQNNYFLMLFFINFSLSVFCQENKFLFDYSACKLKLCLKGSYQIYSELKKDYINYNFIDLKNKFQKIETNEVNTVFNLNIYKLNKNEIFNFGKKDSLIYLKYKNSYKIYKFNHY